MRAPLAGSSRVLETIDERLKRCGISRRAFLKFRSSLMIAAPFGLAITDMKTPAAGALLGAGFVASRNFSKLPGGRNVPGSGPPGGGKNTTDSSQTDRRDNL